MTGDERDFVEMRWRERLKRETGERVAKQVKYDIVYELRHLPDARALVRKNLWR